MLSYEVWCRLKRRGEDRHMWIWKFKRPFKEYDYSKSRATVERGVMEVYYRFKSTDRLDTKATARNMGRGLSELLGKPRYITNVEFNHDMATAAFYCRCSEESLPAEEVMRRVPEVIEGSMAVRDPEDLDI